MVAAQFAAPCDPDSPAHGESISEETDTLIEPTVATRLGEWLGGRVWEPFETNSERNEWFVWLHRLSRAEFHEAKTALRDSALRATAHNQGVATLLAGVFAGFSHFAVEAEILAATRASLQDGRLHARQAEVLCVVGQAAEENDRRVRGE